MRVMHGAGMFAISSILFLGLSAAARADTVREQEFAEFIRPAYPFFLAKAGLWNIGPDKMQPLADQAARGVAAVAPPECDGTGFQRDFCCMPLRTMAATSMEPTLREQEYFMARPYQGSKPKRGDVILFKKSIMASGRPDFYIKRLIGLPGEKVELRGGTVFIDGKAFATKPTPGVLKDILGREAKIFDEATPEGRHYEIAMTGEPIAGQDDAGPFEVPPDHYFVLGDNRHNSADSRFPDQIGDNGFVPAADVAGQAVVIFVSSDADRIGRTLD